MRPGLASNDLQVLKTATNSRGQLAARRRGAHAAAEALEQGCPQIALKLLHSLGDRRLGQEHVIGGRPNAACGVNQDYGLQVPEIRRSW
jgi:hypothetical protein